MDLKRGLHMVIAATRDKEASDLIPLVDDSPPTGEGRWTAKDNLAHMSAWRIHAADVINAARTDRPEPVGGDTVDERNAKIHESTRDLPAAKVLADARASWDALRAAIEACAEEVLVRQRPGNAGEVWGVVPGNTHFHLGEHLGYWNSEHGDEAAAEAAAVWAYELNNEAFPEDRARGYAAYNLGCYFARNSRAKEAAGYLKRGIELVPSLRDWAQKDTDLDPIRSTPELAALLA